MTEIIYTGKRHLALMLFSHLGITQKDEAKIKIAKKVLEGYGSLALTTVRSDDGLEEYCFTMNEFPPSPPWRKEEGFLQGLSVIVMAMEEFFRATSTGEKRITCMLYSHLGITDENTREIEIAKEIIRKSVTVKLVVLTVEGGEREYCYVIDEFSPEPPSKEESSVLQNIDAIGVATNEFFEQVRKK